MGVSSRLPRGRRGRGEEVPSLGEGEGSELK
jgi:hypothetical protein